MAPAFRGFISSEAARQGRRALFTSTACPYNAWLTCGVRAPAGFAVPRACRTPSGSSSRYEAASTDAPGANTTKHDRLLHRVLLTPTFPEAPRCNSSMDKQEAGCLWHNVDSLPTATRKPHTFGQGHQALPYSVQTTPQRTSLSCPHNAADKLRRASAGVLGRAGACRTPSA